MKKDNFFREKDMVCHYDKLIDENNDPVHDPEPLKAYMDKWDGNEFLSSLKLNKQSSVLEICVGTGRLAVRTAPLCRRFCGIDISPKTIKRASENLKKYDNVLLITGDFLSYIFTCSFDIIYSSLTFMHIKDKQRAIDKAAALLSDEGRFVLSIDKNQDRYIDTGVSKIEIYPDDPKDIAACIKNAGMILNSLTETEFAYIFCAGHKRKENL